MKTTLKKIIVLAVISVLCVGSTLSAYAGASSGSVTINGRLSSEVAYCGANTQNSNDGVQITISSQLSTTIGQNAQITFARVTMTGYCYVMDKSTRTYSMQYITKSMDLSSYNGYYNYSFPVSTFDTDRYMVVKIFSYKDIRFDIRFATGSSGTGTISQIDTNQ